MATDPYVGQFTMDASEADTLMRALVRYMNEPGVSLGSGLYERLLEFRDHRIAAAN